MKKRTVYRVKFRKDVPAWVITWKGGPVAGEGESAGFAKKDDAVDVARKMARDRWERYGELAQLMVHRKDGQFQYEHTYGEDPRSSKG